MMSDDQDQPIVETRDLSLSFGQVQAFQGVSLKIRHGEITAIVGDNGAGKSTLIRCIAGVHTPSSGTIYFDGTEVRFSDPDQARKAGIETVHQNLALVEDLTIWQNLFLNRELRFGRLPISPLRKREMRERAADMIAQLAVNVPPVTSTVRRLSGGQRQAVAICRAASFSSKLVIMDEPTAALGVQETERVEELIRDLRASGRAVVLISHNFDQVIRLADHVHVMRSGRNVAERRVADTNGQEIVALITGVLAE